jgi:hypothetical protein
MLEIKITTVPGLLLLVGLLLVIFCQFDKPIWRIPPFPKAKRLFIFVFGICCIVASFILYSSPSPLPS